MKGPEPALNGTFNVVQSYGAKLPAVGAVGAVVAQQEELVVPKIPSFVFQTDDGWESAQVVLHYWNVIYEECPY